MEKKFKLKSIDEINKLEIKLKSLLKNPKKNFNEIYTIYQDLLVEYFVIKKDIDKLI